MNKLMNNNFNAFFESWCLLSQEKFDKSTILLQAFTFKYNPTCKQGKFKQFVVSALNCRSFTKFQTVTQIGKVKIFTITK